MQSKRSPLGDNIFKEHRGSGVVITVSGSTPSPGRGKGRTSPRAATTKTEAKQWREDRIDAIKQKRRFTDDESITALADTWLAIREEAMEDGTLAPKTYHADKHAADTIKAWFKNMSSSDVTTQKVREFNQAMKSGKASLSSRPLAPSSRDSILGLLSQMFARKIAENHGGFNPVSGLASTERSQRREREPVEMSLKQIDDFLYFAEKRTPAYRPLFQLLALTGMRVEEALNLRWENLIVIDGDKDYLEITNGKQRRAREFKVVRLVPVSRDLKTMLVELKLAAPQWASRRRGVRLRVRPRHPQDVPQRASRDPHRLRGGGLRPVGGGACPLPRLPALALRQRPAPPPHLRRTSRLLPVAGVEGHDHVRPRLRAVA